MAKVLPAITTDDFISENLLKKFTRKQAKHLKEVLKKSYFEDHVREALYSLQELYSDSLNKMAPFERGLSQVYAASVIYTGINAMGYMFPDWAIEQHYISTFPKIFAMSGIIDLTNALSEKALNVNVKDKTFNFLSDLSAQINCNLCSEEWNKKFPGAEMRHFVRSLVLFGGGLTYDYLINSNSRYKHKDNLGYTLAVYYLPYLLSDSKSLFYRIRDAYFDSS